ncbi:MAG: hypothetical protein H0W58_07545 [Acidobacteria bacterium]|nr:hypothetical protein [Acidobacteriota bacterium]
MRVVFFCERREDGAGFGGGRFDRDARIERSESAQLSGANPNPLPAPISKSIEQRRFLPERIRQTEAHSGKILCRVSSDSGTQAGRKPKTLNFPTKSFYFS